MGFHLDGKRLGLAAVCFLITPHLAALPDLVPSTIAPSEENPEPTEQITISVTINNTGDAYHDQVVSTPVAFHDDSSVEGAANDGSNIAAGTPSPVWMAQSFISSSNVNVGKVSFFLTDMGTSDEVTLEVRESLNISTPVPSPSP